MAVQIVVDSTADIPRDRARDLGIEVVPLTVMFGDQSFQDGVDLDGPAFYQKLSNSPVMPTTSTPPPALFEETYRRLIENGATGILSMHISGKLSGTFSAARQGAEAVTADTHVPIEVVDSDTVTRIAMAEDLVDGSIIVMYCNEEWGTVAAERHPDLDTAQRSADAAYAGMALGWIEREPHGDEEREVRTTRDFLREIARDFGDG